MIAPIRTLDPHPRAGWEPDTPVEDSLLRAFLVNWTLSVEAHERPFNARTLRRDDLAAVDVRHPSVGVPDSATPHDPLEWRRGGSYGVGHQAARHCSAV